MCVRIGTDRTQRTTGTCHYFFSLAGLLPEEAFSIFTASSSALSTCSTSGPKKVPPVASLLLTTSRAFSILVLSLMSIYLSETKVGELDVRTRVLALQVTVEGKTNFVSISIWPTEELNSIVLCQVWGRLERKEAKRILLQQPSLVTWTVWVRNDADRSRFPFNVDVREAVRGLLAARTIVDNLAGEGLLHVRNINVVGNKNGSVTNTLASALSRRIYDRILFGPAGIINALARKTDGVTVTVETEEGTWAGTSLDVLIKTGDDSGRRASLVTRSDEVVRNKEASDSCGPDTAAVSRGERTVPAVNAGDACLAGADRG